MRKTLCGSALLLATTCWINGGAAAADTKFVIANNTPRFVAGAQKVANVDPAQVIDVTLWLNPHNRAALDKLVQREYDRTSPLYHHFISREALGRLIGPSDDEFASVVKFAQAHNLTFVTKDKFNLFARVRGTVDAVQKAFGVQLAYVSFKGHTYRVNLGDPSIADAAGAYVMAIGGLDDVKFEHTNIAQLAALPGGKAQAPAGSRGSEGFSNVCFSGTTSETFNSGGADPTGTFTGNLYAKDPAGCGYTPPEIQAAYGLTSLYANGLTGAGQTIVILDWCGEETITSDANKFSAKFGLPALTPLNFAIVNYPGASDCAAPDPEINIDVEWAHAIAPGANIVLLVPPSATFPDVDAGLVYEVENGVGNISSNSYGSEEAFTSSSVVQLQSFILESGAAAGISFNFSSGDGGDYVSIYGGTPSVITPADSPYAVAVGGISLSLDKTNSILFQAGWGTNATLISEPGFVPDPSFNFGFQYGSGGGISAVFPKPSYQSALAGKFRKLPDISWLADPFTGGVIAITEPGYGPSPIYQVYGGTSLACPMFSGLWAIANQAAGVDLGQASPYLYKATAGTITDILPVGSTTNVKAVYTENGRVTKESAASLAQPLETTKTYISGIWNYPYEQDFAYVLTFGTDTGLKTAPGWDDVTGLGVANPGALINYVQSNP
jgi:subtilase family serine protease